MKKFVGFLIITHQKEQNLKIGIWPLILGYDVKLNLINYNEEKLMKENQTQPVNSFLESWQWEQIKNQTETDQSLILIKGLFIKFSIIWGHKWTSAIAPEYLEIAISEWNEGLNEIPMAAIKEALAYCRINLEWPPSIAEFRNYCKKALGFPSVDEVIQLAIRGDFSNPFVKKLYDSIGSWSFRNDTVKELTKKINDIYQDCGNNQMLDLKNQRNLLDEQSQGCDRDRDQSGSGSVQSVKELLLP